MCPANTNQKKSWRSSVNCRQSRHRSKESIRAWKGHRRMTKGPALQEDVILNVPAPDNSVRIYGARTGKLQRKIDDFTIIIGDLTPLCQEWRKISKNTVKLSNTLSHPDLIDSWTTLSNNSRLRGLFKLSGAFPKLDYILGQKDTSARLRE